MLEKEEASLREASPYNAAITREQFLFYEMRTTAKLICEGLSNEDAVDRIVNENLFQYPTEKSVRKMALSCIRRLEYLEDEEVSQTFKDASEAGVEFWEIQMDFRPEGVTLYSITRSADLYISVLQYKLSSRSPATIR